jgi:hypothetical protein
VIFLRILFNKFNKLLCYEYFSSEQNERNIEREREKERGEIERREEEKREKERREEKRKEKERREKRNNNNRQNDLARLLGKLQYLFYCSIEIIFMRIFSLRARRKKYREEKREGEERK